MPISEGVELIKSRNKVVIDMPRFITFEALSKETISADKIECTCQIWDNDAEWLGYVNKPRPCDGLLLFNSDIVGEYYINGEKSFSASKGDAIYIPQGSLYRLKFKNGGKDTDIFTVNFILSDSDGNTLRMADSATLFPSLASQSCRNTAFELANAILFSENLLKRQTLLLSLLDSFCSSFEKQSKIYYTIKKGILLLQEEWNRNEKNEKYAKICGISESGFYTYFKEWSGVSPKEYKNRFRINVAKSLLENSNLQISEIASRVGFDDPYYFSRLFKKTVGVSPRAFRNG